MNNSPKTIFLTIFHLLASRNILGSDVYETLTADPNLRLVIFVPAYKRDFIEETYGRKNVEIIGIDENNLINSFPFRFFKYLAWNGSPTYTMKLRAWEILHKKGGLLAYLEYYFKRFLSLIFGQSRLLRQILRRLDYWVGRVNRQQIKNYFQQYQPQLLFVTDIYAEPEVVFLQAAKENRVKSAAMVRSWDNNMTKGILRVIPDVVITNNEIIKEEIAAIHDVKPETIFVGGIPQYDSLLHGYHSDRQSFFKKIGADPKKRLILFAPAGYILSDTDWQICELLRQGLDQGKIPPDLQFLVRKHPADPAQLDQFVADERFIIEWPGKKFGQRLKVTEFSPEDQKHLIDSLFHSEILIQVNSSIGLDWLALDKPQIMIEFDGWEKKPYIKSVARFHDEEHMIKFIDTGAAKVAGSPEELYFWINRYLENPNLDREKRKLALQQQYQFLDGQSGKRIGQFILGLVSS